MPQYLFMYKARSWEKRAARLFNEFLIQMSQLFTKLDIPFTKVLGESDPFINRYPQDWESGVSS